VDAESESEDGVSLKAIPVTLSGTSPLVEAKYKSYGDVGGLFIETSGALTEDVHPDGTSLQMAEFPNITGDFHGKIFATQNNSSNVAPWWHFAIKHGNDIGIVSPFATARVNEPGYLEVYAYDTALGMPSGSPTIVHFSAIADSYYSVLISLAKIGTKYYAVHKVYKQGVAATTAQEYAFYGAIHSADGTIDSSWKIEDAVVYTPARVPSAQLANLGEATQNNWVVRIKKATTVWTSLTIQVVNGLTALQYDTSLSVVNVGGDDYYEGTVTTWGVDASSTTVRFKFTASGTDTGWSSGYAHGANGVVLDTGSDAAVAYVERAAYATGHGVRMAFRDDDPKVDRVQAELNTSSAFDGTIMWAYGPSKDCLQTSPPFSYTPTSSVAFIENPTASVSFRIRACDIASTYTAYSVTLTVTLDATTEYVTNRLTDFPNVTEVTETSDSDYVKVVVTEWTDEDLQNYNSIAPKLQVRNIANADTLFTCLNRTTTTVTSGSSVDTEDNILVALESTGVTEKTLTDSSFGGFYADATMSGENGVAFITKDFDTQVLSYHDSFTDATPTSLGVTAGVAWWWAVVKLRGTLSAVVNILFGGGGIYYKPVTGVGSWTLIADSEHSDMKHMSPDPWGQSFYFGDDENGLILRYVVAVTGQSNAVWYFGI
jgi:hypothetical protein